MTKSDDFFKDICNRIPYGLMCVVYGDDKNPLKLTGIKDSETAYFEGLDWKESDGMVEIKFLTPYLRRMNSMS